MANNNNKQINKNHYKQRKQTNNNCENSCNYITQRIKLFNTKMVLNIEKNILIL